MYKAVSLFAGAGGMDVGFARAGVVPQVVNDIDGEACATYRKNHAAPVLEGHVRDFLGDFAGSRGVDFVFGGPPCQGFSVAGKMNPDDERSALIHTYLDVVDIVRPRAFVCENVKALASLTRWKPVRDALVARASKHYVTGLLILNSQDYGVPQTRERMFLVGFHRDEMSGSREALEAGLHALLKGFQSKAPQLRNLIRGLGRAGTPGNPRICRAKITFAKTPVLRRSPYAGMLFNGAGRPLAASGHSSTLPASMGGNKTPIVDEAVIFEDRPSFVEQYHARLWGGGAPYQGNAPGQLRRLTVDECLAIQTFPADYAFSGSQSAMYRQIGNAVPCNLAEAVAKAAIAVLERKEKILGDGLMAAE